MAGQKTLDWSGASGKSQPMFSPEDYLDLEHTEHQQLFEGLSNVWEVLPRIADYLKFRLHPESRGRLEGSPFIGPEVFIGEGTVVEHGAMIKGPAWIGSNCVVRNGCYVRENVIVGNNAVLGNSCEFKNSVIFDSGKIPHFSYVGDSVIGFKGHLGAGVILSNVKLDRSDIAVEAPGGTISTGLRKFGAIIGDGAEIGCNAVLSPGSIIGKDSLVYPCSQWRGVLAANRVAKNRQTFETVERRP